VSTFISSLISSAPFDEALYETDHATDVTSTIFNADQIDFLNNLWLTLADVQAALPDTPSFVGWDDNPCPAIWPEFFTNPADDARLGHWAALASDTPVDGVQ